MGIGNFLEKNFKNKEVELFTDHDFEWIGYAEATIINAMIIHGIFLEYDEEAGILILENLHNGEIFYVAESFVQVFWRPGFKLLESARPLINTGKKLFKNPKDGV